MAVCEDCGQEMLVADACSFRSVMIFRGEVFNPVVYGSETIWPGRLTGRCGDCGVAVGGGHHFGCDMEQCPRCRQQLIGCDCVEEFDLSPIPS